MVQKLLFLGTGTSQGIPIIGSEHPVCLSEDFKDKRLRSSVVFKIGGINLLIDCGPDFRQQMLKTNTSFIDAILFTHEHNDHVIGLDDIRPLAFKSRKDMPVYGQKRVLEDIRKRFPYIYSTKKYPGVPTVIENEVMESDFFVESILIRPIKIMHGKLPILGYRVKNVAYITDASHIETAEKDKLKNLDILVLNALRVEPKHYSHFILDEALEVIKELKPKRAYLTHISHLLGFHEEVQKQLPDNVFLSYDGLELDF